MVFSSQTRLVVTIVIVVLLVISTATFFLLHQDIPEPTTTPQQVEPPQTRQVLGTSIEGREIEAFTYGAGDTNLLFIGGIHGGYEWNSVVLAYTFIDQLETTPEIIPQNLSVTIIPSANPDGIFKVIGKEGRFTAADVPNTDTVPGRFNANDVDLNRNFDCNWQPEAVWRSNPVSAGAAPFSEPETKVLRDHILKTKPTAVIMWHSQASAVYPADCNGIIPDKNLEIMNIYADAAGYQAIETFNAYTVTGAADGWLALLDIPALTVELHTHETVEWEPNFAAIKALFGYYSLRKNQAR